MHSRITQQSIAVIASFRGLRRREIHLLHQCIGLLSQSDKLDGLAMNDAIEQTPDAGKITPEALINGVGETEFTVSPRRAAVRALWAEIVFVVALGLYGMLAA